MAKKEGSGEGEKVVSVHSRIRIIQIVSCLEIAVSMVILLSQTIAIAASYEYATRSLTGVWTSWFFFMAAGLTLFWSLRCTFNGLLAVLVLQIIAGTMTVPLFTASCILLGVYNFVWDREEGNGEGMVGSSITIMSTNVLMTIASVVELGLNSYNAYVCYHLAYGGGGGGQQGKENNYDQGSISSSGGTSEGGGDEGREGMTMMREGEEDDDGDHHHHDQTASGGRGKSDSDLMVIEDITPVDILIMKFCAGTGLLLSIIIFAAQTTMLALNTNNDGIKVGVGIWGSLFFVVTAIVTFHAGYKPTPQSMVTVFSLQLTQIVLSIPMVCISYYIVAAFGSCLQHIPFDDCSFTGPQGFGGADLAVVIMGGIMAICAMVEGLVSLITVLICAQAVCGIRCMISGAVVYPSS